MSISPEPPVCEQCGQPHTRCAAHSKQAQPLRPCANHPGPGAIVCRFHGGGAKQVKAKAAKRAAENQALELLGNFGLVADLSELAPIQVAAELQLQAAQLRHTVEWLRIQVLEESDEEKLLTWEKLYAERQRDLTRLLTEMSRVGIEERAVQIQEAQLRGLAQAFQVFARALGHDPAVPAVRAHIRAALESVEP